MLLPLLKEFERKAREYKLLNEGKKVNINLILKLYKLPFNYENLKKKINEAKEKNILKLMKINKIILNISRNINYFANNNSNLNKKERSNNYIEN